MYPPAITVSATCREIAQPENGAATTVKPAMKLRSREPSGAFFFGFAYMRPVCSLTSEVGRPCWNQPQSAASHQLILQRTFSSLGLKVACASSGRPLHYRGRWETKWLVDSGLHAAFWIAWRHSYSTSLQCYSGVTFPTKTGIARDVDWHPLRTVKCGPSAPKATWQTGLPACLSC